jgi:hypothetical protein
MKLFYLDESGNPELTGSSDSYVLVAVGIPIEKWTACDKAINQLKASYNLLMPKFIRHGCCVHIESSKK